MGSVTTKLLVTGMLISGVCNTILNKLQDMQCVEDCDSEPKYFEQPVWQTLNMFIGESMCFIAVYLLIFWERWKGIGEYTPQEVERILTADSGISVNEREENSTSLVVEDEHRQELTGWKTVLFWMPAMCDILGTTLMNVGLIYTSASVYQMLRGSVVLFTAIFSVIFLKHNLYFFHWFSLVAVVLGVSIVGMSSVFFPPVSPSDTLVSEEASEFSNTLLGIIFVIGAQLFTATQFVIEESIMRRYRINPLRAVGLEGIFGLITIIIGMILLHFTIGVAHPGGYFDAPAAFRQIIENPGVWISGIAICFSIAFFNFFGLSVTRTVSATSRTTIDTSRILFVWFVSLCLGWESFSLLQVIGFTLLAYGTFVFNGVVNPPSCFTLPSPEEIVG